MVDLVPLLQALVAIDSTSTRSNLPVLDLLEREARGAGFDTRRATWADADGDKWLEFSGTDEALALTSASSVVTVFLNWNQYGNSVTDLLASSSDSNVKTIGTNVGTSQSGVQVAGSIDSGSAPRCLSSPTILSRRASSSMRLSPPSRAW